MTNNNRGDRCKSISGDENVFEDENDVNFADENEQKARQMQEHV